MMYQCTVCHGLTTSKFHRCQHHGCGGDLDVFVPPVVEVEYHEPKITAQVLDLSELHPRSMNRVPAPA